MWKFLSNALSFFCLASVAYGQQVGVDVDKRYSVEIPKGWTVEAGKDDIDLKLGQVTIHVYPASGKLTTLDAVIEDIVQFYSKQGIAAGPKQRLTFAEGEALWTEAPGTERPYLGAVSRGGKFFFVNAEDKAKNSSGVLEAFLAAVRSVRPASSAAALQKTTKPDQKPPQTSQSSSSSSPKATAGPLASAKSDPWNLADLQKEAKAMSSSDIPTLRTRASGGDARSQFLLGLVYEFGHAGIKQDLEQALSWFKKAAEQGIGLPQRWVGDFYHGGIGIPVDFAEAMRWYRRSADAGYSYGAAVIGRMHVFGEGVAVNHRAAAQWYRRAVELGGTWVERGPGWIQPWSAGLFESSCHDEFCIGLRQLIVSGWSEEFERYRGQAIPSDLGPTWNGKEILLDAYRCTTFKRDWGVHYNCEYRLRSFWVADRIHGRRQDWESRFDEIVGRVSGAVPAAWRGTHLGKISKILRIGPGTGLHIEVKEEGGGPLQLTIVLPR